MVYLLWLPYYIFIVYIKNADISFSLYIYLFIYLFIYFMYTYS